MISRLTKSGATPIRVALRRPLLYRPPDLSWPLSQMMKTTVRTYVKDRGGDDPDEKDKKSMQRRVRANGDGSYSAKKREDKEKKEEKQNEKQESDKSVDKSSGSAPSGVASGSSGSSTAISSGSSNTDFRHKKLLSSSAYFKEASPENKRQVLPLVVPDRPLIPGYHRAVKIKDREVIQLIRRMFDDKLDDQCIAVFLSKTPRDCGEVLHNVDEAYSAGCYARIGGVYFFRTFEGVDEYTITLYPIERVQIGTIIDPNDVTTAADENVGQSMDFYKAPVPWMKDVKILHDEPYDKKSKRVQALCSEIIQDLSEMAKLNVTLKEQISSFTMMIPNMGATKDGFEEPRFLADFCAAICSGSTQIQEVLECTSVEQRLEKVLVLIKTELEQTKIQERISREVSSRIDKRQKEYYLNEQMKGIKKELGIDDGKDKLIQEFKERVEKLTLPENVEKAFNEEINKLMFLEPAAAEFNVSRGYLDWLTQLPWGIYTEDTYNIKSAVETLDTDHFGLEDVKDRILEFIAVGKLVGSVNGKIICFVGPPGVGKTSIGKSIANALNRKFDRFSVGGMSDVSEIKGHRRTYIGAMPGKFVQSLKRTQTQNPLILIDEIDKATHGGGNHGDPLSALLEVLDPEQNSTFMDTYLDLPVDLSKVLFVCTANRLDTIPLPLRDRMEIIEIPGYILPEKVAIAERFLAPTAQKESGLSNVNISFEAGTLDVLISRYSRENGVRGLKKMIEKIYRKVAHNLVKKYDEIPKDEAITITADSLAEYLGPPRYLRDKIYDKPPAGVVMGLAASSLGGSSLYIESVLERPLHHGKSPRLNKTGQLGNVMNESVDIAYSFAQMFLSSKFPENRFFEKAAIHVHSPEGAVPKDGPSAGITLTTSLLSLALKTPVDTAYAMTGELTLTGKVLRIGGLREKTMAAKASGATKIIFPDDNKADWDELPDNVKEGMTAIPVGWYSQVFDELFGKVPEQEAETTWSEELAKCT